MSNIILRSPANSIIIKTESSSRVSVYPTVINSTYDIKTSGNNSTANIDLVSSTRAIQSITLTGGGFVY